MSNPGPESKFAEFVLEYDLTVESRTKLNEELGESIKVCISKNAFLFVVKLSIV